MAIRRYLAMTAGEIEEYSDTLGNLAWMACHFSPYGRGLSNLPRTLPQGALLMVDDITPIHGHDPKQIGTQLTESIRDFSCPGVLLDFQREGYEESRKLASYLSQALPCPVGVAEGYGDGLDCAVFLPPVPCWMPLGEYLAPWCGQEVWLEIALEGAVLTVREDGTEITPLPCPNLGDQGFAEEQLHCHYTIREQETEVMVTLWRTQEDLEGLLKEAEELGVTVAVGLYQEFRSSPVLQEATCVPSMSDNTVPP